MNAVVEFDIGPLTWVKSEIDLALERAGQALQNFAADTEDPTQIKFCRNYLHQVRGALTIVELDGVTQFIESLEALLSAVEDKALAIDDTIIRLIRKSLETVGRYLDDLIDGHRNLPLQLFPLYRSVQFARGITEISAVDLFFPNLEVRPPPRTTPPAEITPQAYQEILRQARNRYQKGFLFWLRAPRDPKGLGEMLGAVASIESTQNIASARTFWWIATGLFTALLEGSIPEENNIKSLCTRIDMQIRRLLEGSKNVAERLIRDALYLVAIANSTSPIVQEIRDAYQLQALIASAEIQVNQAPQQLILRKLRDQIQVAQETWNKFCSGTTQALRQFNEQCLGLSVAVEKLGNTDYKRLMQAIVGAAKWITNDLKRNTDALDMEVATALLLAQNAQESFDRLGKDFVHQVDVMVERIHACLAGKPPLPGSEIPLLDAMSRKAHDRLLNEQVAKEIQTNMAQIEQVLDNFFRSNDKRGDLLSLENPLRQVIGALTMMRHDSAVKMLRECSEKIRLFADPNYLPEESDFERVANQLSLLGFFVDSLHHGDANFDAFIEQMQSKQQEIDEEPEGQSVEHEVKQQVEDVNAKLDTLKTQPDDANLREEIRQDLTALKSNADLVADEKLGKQTKAALSALATDTDLPSGIDQALTSLKSQQPEVPKPTAEIVHIAQASREEIDAELLGIFLEEANEVQQTIATSLNQLKEEPHNIEQLTTIRRAFHTLKGSGRMVGLKDLGEAAWAMEQTLNLWLRLELDIQAPLIDLIDLAHIIFSDWVLQLETNSGEAPDASRMIALAESLRSSNEDISAQRMDVDTPAPAEAISIVAETPEETPQASWPLEVEVHEEEQIDIEAMPGLSTDYLADEVLPEDTHVEIIDLEINEPQASDHHAQPIEPLSLESTGPIILPDEDDTLKIADFVSQEDDDTEQSSPILPNHTPEPLSLESGEEKASERAPQQRITISPTLYAIFSEEAKSYLVTLHGELEKLEEDRTQPTAHAMYRAAHTLAGIAGTVGLKPINELGLALEHALLRRDKFSQQDSLEALAVIRRAIEHLDQMFAELAQQREPGISEELLAELDTVYPSSIPSLQEEQELETLPTEELVEVKAIPLVATSTTEFHAAQDLAVTAKPFEEELDPQLLPIFLDEALELNQEIAATLRAWRDTPENRDTIGMLARLLHTLKGSARMAGAMNLGELTHLLESRVEEAAQQSAVATQTIDEIDSAFDAIRQMIDLLAQGTPSKAPETATADEDKRPVVGFDARRESIIDIDTDTELEAEPESDPAVQRATIRVRVDLIDRLGNEAGEMSIARTRIEGEMRSLKTSLFDLTENVIRLRRQVREIEIQAESQMQSRIVLTDEQHSGFDPLELDRFTHFQELTRMMAESVNDVATIQQSLLKNLDEANAAILAQSRMNRELQQELMTMRMVPFMNLSDRLYRVARQTSKELGKRVNLDIKGDQIELDRSVLEKLSAPLEHMLRNAIVHGLEERSERLDKDKPEIGEISLVLEQEGNEIILNFSDDGAGLDYRKIRAKAIANGLLNDEDEIERERLAEFIFEPGFSTASEISQIAGRGIGMDVVKTEIARIGGRIEIASELNKGTQFKLYIPLTLAMTRALLVRAGAKSYAIPSVMVEQVSDYKEAELSKISKTEQVVWMDNTYPFSYLPRLLGDMETQPDSQRQYWIILLRSGAHRVAVLVDALIGNEEIVVKNTGPQIAHISGISGATVLGNGEILLILNPIALYRRAQQYGLSTGLSVSTQVKIEAPIDRLPMIMIVDDSMTVRKITGRLLAREGYHVLTAKDGVEAVEKLADVTPDIMLVDIEMPRMDGFDLTRNIRADNRLSKIPIIMITSRIAEKHRNYAFEIGVNHYLGKPYQEEELLQIIADILKDKHLI